MTARRESMGGSNDSGDTVAVLIALLRKHYGPRECADAALRRLGYPPCFITSRDELAKLSQELRP